MKKVTHRISDQWWAIRMGIAILDDYRFLKKSGQKGRVYTTHLRNVRQTRRDLRSIAEALNELAGAI